MYLMLWYCKLCIAFILISINYDYFRNRRDDSCEIMYQYIRDYNCVKLFCAAKTRSPIITLKTLLNCTRRALYESSVYLSYRAHVNKDWQYARNSVITEQSLLSHGKSHSLVSVKKIIDRECKILLLSERW